MPDHQWVSAPVQHFHSEMHKIFPLHTMPEKFKSYTKIVGYFGFVFEDNLGMDIT